MILLHFNKKLKDEVISILVDTYKNEKYLPIKNGGIDNFYTNYYHKDTEDCILKNYYEQIIEKSLQYLGLKNRCDYDLDFWIQIYNNTTEGFGYHDHFTGTEFLSWIHFIKTPRQKCFHFIDSFGNKQYPDNQSDGDFIFFPCWALHAVDKIEDTDFDRIIASGNIGINHYISGQTLWSSKEDDCGVRWEHHSIGLTLNP